MDQTMQKSFLGLISGAAIAVGMGAMTAPAAEAFVITTGSGAYELSALPGSFDNNATELTTNALWNDQTLSTEIANAVFGNWDDFAAGILDEQGIVIEHAYFAYQDQPGSSFSAVNFLRVSSGQVFAPSFGIFKNFNLSGSTNFGEKPYYVTAQSVAVAVPTPAAILPGLVGMGLSAIRKRRALSSEEA